MSQQPNEASSLTSAQNNNGTSATATTTNYNSHHDHDHDHHHHHHHHNSDNKNDDSIRATTMNTPTAKKISWIGMSFLCFVSTSAGPCGLDAVLSNSGALISFLVICLYPIVFNIPLILMIEEVGSWLNSTHGSIRYIARAFGEKVGFINAFLQLMMNFIDLSIYPVMSQNNLFQQFHPTASYAEKYFFRLGIILVFSIPCFLPLQASTITSFILTLLIVTPFLVGFFASIPSIDTTVWGDKLQGTGDNNLNLSTVLSIGSFMFSGFLANASLFQEIQSRAMIRGQLTALGGDFLIYFLPLAATVSVNTDWSGAWSHEGYLNTAFDTILPGLGKFCAIACCISGISLYTSSLVFYSRTVWGIADLKMAPKIFKRLNRFNSPYLAAILHMVIAALLDLMDFEFLVTLEFLFASIIIVLFALAFLTLRFTEPVETRTVLEIDVDDIDSVSSSSSSSCDSNDDDHHPGVSASQARSDNNNNDDDNNNNDTNDNNNIVENNNDNNNNENSESEQEHEDDKMTIFVIPGGNVVAVLITIPLIFVMSATFVASITDWRFAVAFISAILVASLLYYYLNVYGQSDAEILAREEKFKLSLRRSIVSRHSLVSGGGDEFFDQWTDVGTSHSRSHSNRTSHRSRGRGTRRPSAAAGDNNNNRGSSSHHNNNHRSNNYGSLDSSPVTEDLHFVDVANNNNNNDNNVGAASSSSSNNNNHNTTNTDTNPLSFDESRKTKTKTTKKKSSSSGKSTRKSLSESESMVDGDDDDMSDV